MADVRVQYQSAYNGYWTDSDIRRVHPDDLARAIRAAVDARLRDVVKALSRHQDLCMRTLGVFNASYIGTAILNMLDTAPREPAREQEGNWVLNTTTTRPALEAAQERQEAPTPETHVDKALAWDTMDKACIRARAAGFAEGVEAAARVLDDGRSSAAPVFAERIRALTPPTPTPDPLLPGLRAARQMLDLVDYSGMSRDDALATLRNNYTAEIARREEWANHRPWSLPDIVAEAIRAAVAAETERCAKVADNYWPSSPSAAGEHAMRDMRDRIAAAIREAPPPQETQT